LPTLREPAGAIDPVIEIEELSKLYRLGIHERRSDTLAGAIVSWIRSPAASYRGLRNLSRFDNVGAADVLWALREVSLSVSRGEVVGIIGRNGAGKSTLLKILSRITAPTFGRVTIDGRVASLLEVGTGFHPELTGRENIYLNGSILGMTKREIDRQFDEIVAFSGVEKFLDTPVKRYSSGMQVRLAFSVAAHLDPEILIVDEVLAVGDAEFQAKCIGKMQNVSEGGRRTVLFVSHNMGAIKALCTRCVLLDAGRVVTSGSPDEVITRYLSGGDGSAREVIWESSTAPGSHELRMRSVRVLDARGDASSSLATGNDVFVEVCYEVHTDLSNLRIALTLIAEDGTIVLASSDFHQQGERRHREPGEYLSVCRIPGGFLNLGRYIAAVDAEIPRVAAIVTDVHVPFEMEELTTNHLGITLTRRPRGVVHPNLEWKVTRRRTGASASAPLNAGSPGV
jgi:lipopolysaccharide transport system ATP-binding protein